MKLIFGGGVDVGHECGKESLKDQAASIWVFAVRTYRALEATYSSYHLITPVLVLGYAGPQSTTWTKADEAGGLKAWTQWWRLSNCNHEVQGEITTASPNLVKHI